MCSGNAGVASVVCDAINRISRRLVSTWYSSIGASGFQSCFVSLTYLPTTTWLVFIPEVVVLRVCSLIFKRDALNSTRGHNLFWGGLTWCVPVTRSSVVRGGGVVSSLSRRGIPLYATHDGRNAAPRIVSAGLTRGSDGCDMALATTDTPFSERCT